MSSATNDRAPRENWLLVGGLAVAAGLMRLVPGLPMHLTPVGALGLFAGACFRSWWAFAVPLAIMAGSDLLLWQLRGVPPFDPWVYASFLIYVLAGRLFLRSPSPARIGVVSVLAAVQFFLITNFGVWLAGSTNPDRTPPPGEAVALAEIEGIPLPVPTGYSHDLKGLLTCYVYAVPFARAYAPAPLGWFGNTLAGDLFFTYALFGLAAFGRRTVSRPAGSPVTSQVGSGS
jgi:hypothetical protein